ncbi:MAG TPA: hypothetical protein VF843_11925 [Streptosporangiaceae bacterium]
MEPGSQPRLAQVLEFTPGDLAANRAGELSASQLARLRGPAMRPGSRSRSRTGLIAVAIVIVLVAAAVLPGLGGHGRASAGVPFLVAAVILIALLLWQSWARAGRSAGRLAGGAVSYAEGVAKARPAYAAPSPVAPAGQEAAAEQQRELTIGGTAFLVSPSVQAAFVQGRAYRAYYVGQGPRATIVSAELI